MPGSAPEWPQTLDVAALMEGGWRPVPFNQFVVKVQSRCDLSCDYCYVYEMADQSWRGRPARMPTQVAEQTASRIGKHARAHQLPEITLVLHGGEPLLAGPDLIWNLVTATRKAAAPDTRVTVVAQTNGVGLDESYLELFNELDVHVGVSLDGSAQAHNRHRRFASGRGSYPAVVAALKRLDYPRYRHLFNGLLCTVDLRNDPLETYEELSSFNPPRIDFLLPHGTWDMPPPGHRLEVPSAPYADWLIAVFNQWYLAPRTGIRLFEDIIKLLVGGTPPSETVGLSPARMVVIESDGSIEQVDTLKAAYQGAAQTGRHVNDEISDETDLFGEVLLLPGVVARQIGTLALAANCRRCPVQQTCGGGMYTHRYRKGTGFANPSVYCDDLFRLITHIQRVVERDISARPRDRT